jgi:hypothetical protein
MAAQSKPRSCPYCREEIKPDAIRCKHCRSALAPDQPSHGGTCPLCKEEIHPEAVKCKHCGSAVGPRQGCEGCQGSEGSDEAAVAGLMARQRGTVVVGPGRGAEPSCATRWMACKVRCTTNHPNDPLMRQACEDSCDASYRLCTSLSGGIAIF